VGRAEQSSVAYIAIEERLLLSTALVVMATPTKLDVPHILSLRWTAKHSLTPHQIIS
jgi:hypothetical protein